MRRHGRIDQNHRDIVAALEAVGCSVQSLAAIGRGCPDLLVGSHRGLALLEVKRPLGPRGGTSDRELTPDQLRWTQRWRGPQVMVVRSVAEALLAVGVTKEVRHE